ncbi:phosphopantothenoylcysteine decarboxylase/phosphopantothenate--cysteine ligase [Dyadobacter jejuensis]|uniref:Coenzyme A biosynthesis bifunctional protein CoaBC n=1 Tax=Dyadobacter jejuensis TaxID=1082580 RepID=A0A316AJE9_9BACT|nr:bifunctional phosphopantothenoylcysteine decarboxylase/phosphopantothenate--cysteine ligase CoaBC [Dyadobacter jejuensis]PWJ57104.1 phosphopantothenoylcysteine decarboxylase/phosphopantothenate--cysteine ligase [Dyadobacter jejuensis]
MSLFEPQPTATPSATPLAGKKIVLGVTGSIAAYKSALLIRLLVKEGAEVQVIMTESAQEFITPLTLSTLSKKPVFTKFTEGPLGEWTNHVELGLWADLMLVAPATAKTLAGFANGYCNDLLTATYLSARCPVFVAPAMDLDMFAHPSTQHNLQKLASYGNRIIEPEEGELASGLVGSGRLAEPETIVAILKKHFSFNPVAFQKRVLITAGPTVEAIDPVRFISNRSTGKMGYAIAEAFAAAGAAVTVVSGPVSIELQDSTIRVLPVESAQQMYETIEGHFAQHDLIIFAAAVADYTPKTVAEQKIKKKTKDMQIDLVKTVDIAAAMGQKKQPHQLTIGFALETENELDNALRKLESKAFDYIVLNSLNDPGAGFTHDTNKITVIDKNKTISRFDLKSKTEVAGDILNLVLSKWTEL